MRRAFEEVVRTQGTDHNSSRSQGRVTATGRQPAGTLRPVSSVDLLLPCAGSAEMASVHGQRATLLSMNLRQKDKKASGLCSQENKKLLHSMILSCQYDFLEKSYTQHMTKIILVSS